MTEFFLSSPMHDSSTATRNENILFTVEDRESIEFLSSTTSYSSYAVATTFSWCLSTTDCQVLHATVPYYALAWRGMLMPACKTQLASSYGFKNYKKSNKLWKKSFHDKDEWGIMLVSYIRNFNELARLWSVQMVGIARYAYTYTSKNG